MVPDRKQLIQQFFPYIELQMSRGMPFSKIIRHIIGLFHGQPNGRLWRRYLSENAFKPGAGIEVIERACSLVV